MSSSVIDGLMMFGTVTCSPESTSRAILDPAEAHPNKAVVIIIPATNAPANPAFPFSLVFILFLLTQDSTSPSAAEICSHKIPH